MIEYIQLPISTSKQLAITLRARRKALNLTQKQVARLVGLLPKTVSALETDPDRCSVESLRSLLVALNLELSLIPQGDVARLNSHADTLSLNTATAESAADHRPPYGDICAPNLGFTRDSSDSKDSSTGHVVPTDHSPYSGEW
jgi:HTH-type transcriptional regulator/antitoxin HipB